MSGQIRKNIFYLFYGFIIGFVVLYISPKLIFATDYIFGNDPPSGNFIIKGRVGAGTPTPTPILQLTNTSILTNINLNASYVSSGAFGSNTGGGNYSFPANVGIGTTNPTNIFETNSSGPTWAMGDSATGNKMLFQYGVYGSNVFSMQQSWWGTAAFIFHNRKFGISTDPAAVMDIYNNEDASIPVLRIKQAASPTGDYFQIASNASSNGNIVTVNSAGNVGIGTTGPGQKLSVAGTIESTSGGFKFPDGTTQSTAASAGSAMLTGAQNLSVAGGATVYGTFGLTNSNVTETNRQMPFAKAGTLSKFYIRTQNPQPADGSLVVTIRKNAVNTTLTITVAASGAAGTYSDTTDTVSVSAGDLISVGEVNNSASSGTPIVGFSAVFQ